MLAVIIAINAASNGDLVDYRCTGLSAEYSNGYLSANQPVGVLSP